MDRFTRSYLAPLAHHLSKQLSIDVAQGNSISEKRVMELMLSFNYVVDAFEETPTKVSGKYKQEKLAYSYSDAAKVSHPSHSGKPQKGFKEQKGAFKPWYISSEYTIIENYKMDQALLIGRQSTPLFHRGFFRDLNGEDKFMFFNKHTQFGPAWVIEDATRLSELEEALEAENQEFRKVQYDDYLKEANEYWNSDRKEESVAKDEK